MNYLKYTCQIKALKSMQESKMYLNTWIRIFWQDWQSIDYYSLIAE